MTKNQNSIPNAGEFWQSYNMAEKKWDTIWWIQCRLQRGRGFTIQTNHPSGKYGLQRAAATMRKPSEWRKVEVKSADLWVVRRFTSVRSGKARAHIMCADPTGEHDRLDTSAIAEIQGRLVITHSGSVYRLLKPWYKGEPWPIVVDFEMCGVKG